MIRRPPIAVAVAFAVLTWSGAVPAQSSAADVCAGLPTQAEEIACLRGALQESRAALKQGHGTHAAAAPRATQAETVAPVARAPAPRPEQLGSEQVADARRDAAEAKPARQEMRAVAQAVKTDHLGLVTLRLDNGQVWQQAEARGVPLRLRADRRYPVEIGPSGFGGYRMHFTDTGRQIVVRRLQ